MDETTVNRPTVSLKYREIQPRYEPLSPTDLVFDLNLTVGLIQSSYQFVFVG